MEQFRSHLSYKSYQDSITTSEDTLDGMCWGYPTKGGYEYLLGAYKEN